MKQADIVIYQSEDGNTKIETRLENETVWLTQEQMATLFGKGRSTVTEHIGNIFKEGELDESMVCRDFRYTTRHDLLKQAGGGSYFEELLERIREIRSSEKVFWRKVLDIMPPVLIMIPDRKRQ